MQRRSGFQGFVFAFGVTTILLAPATVKGQENLVSLVKRAEPSVVAILTYNKEGKVIGQGTGFFITKSGDVVSNHHVLRGASQAKIKTYEGKIYRVKKVLAEDTVGDLIRLSVDIPEEEVRPLSMRTVPPEVGERIFIIGTPFGLEKTVTDGIVSAIREIPDLGRIVQLTAPISPGSSGSPVLDMKGEVIGVATFFIVAGQNLNFAIPGTRIERLISGKGQSLSEREEVKIEDWLASSEGLYTTGLRFLMLGEYERAIAHFLETVRIDPKHADALYQIGYCLTRLEKYQDAIGPFEEVLGLRPHDPDIAYNLCVAYGKTGRLSEAVEKCTRAIRLKPDLAEAYSNLSWAYYKLGRVDEAIEVAKEAVRLKPDLAVAHFNLGNGYAGKKRYADAVDSYKQAIHLRFDLSEGHVNLGAAYFELGRYEQAIDSYRQAVRVKPTLASAHLNLGVAYLRTGDRISAIEEYKILKELDKELADKLFNLMYE